MDLDSHLSHLWTQEVWRKKYQDTDILSASTTRENKVTKEESVIQAGLAREGQCSLTSEGSCAGREGLLSENDGFETQKPSRNEGQTFQNKRGFGVTSMWRLFLAWALCLLISLLCLLLSAALGSRFSNSQVLLWIQSLLVSLISCIFFVQPALIFAAAAVVSVWYKKAPFSPSSTIKVETLNWWSSSNPPEDLIRASGFLEQRDSHFAKLLGARRRARRLRLVRPPPPAELRRARLKRRREALIHETLRDLSLCAAMLLLMSCVTYYSSFKEDYQLNRAVRRHFIGSHGFVAIKTQEDWWKWTQTTLLDLLEQIQSDKTETSHVGVGDVVMVKTERRCAAQKQVPTLRHFWRSALSCCRSEEVFTAVLRHEKSDAETELEHLRSSGWVDGRTVALKVQFTLYSPAPNLFTSVTLLTERSPSGVLRLSATVRSVRVDPTPGGGYHVVMVCQLLLLLLSLLRLCGQVFSAAQQGLMGDWRTPSTWLDVGLLTATLVYHGCCVYRSVAMAEAVNFLQEHHNKRHVDVSDLSTWEQHVRSLHGIILFLLMMKAVTVLGVNRTFSFSAAVFARSLRSLFCPPSSGLALLVVSSCLGNLLCVQSSGVFSSLRFLLCNYRGLRATGGLSQPDSSPPELLLLSVSVVWTAVVIAVMLSSVRAARRTRSRKNVLTAAEMFSYCKKKASELIWCRQTGTDHREEDGRFLLEELEMSVDELLFRLSALSNITDPPLLPETPACRNKDFPTPQNSHTEDSLRSQTTLNELMHESDQRPAFCPFRLHAEQDVQKVLHQRRKARNYHPDISEESKYCLCCPKSTSVKKILAEDALDTKSSCAFSKTHSEVVVEVLVHKEQETEVLS